MIKNWRVSAILSSPLAGEPTAFDAMIEWEMTRRVGVKNGFKLTRDTLLSDIIRVPIPIPKRTIGSYDVYCCSDPIIDSSTPEWEEHIAKRIDTNMIASLLDPKERKSISVSSGAYKMRFSPVRVRLCDAVYWFVRCEKKVIKDLLKSVHSIGSNKGIGYGIVSSWEFFDMEDYDYSIFAPRNGKKILMKTIPMWEKEDESITGYLQTYGGGLPPYWHPDNYMEIAKPI